MTKNEELKPIAPGPGHLESPGQFAERIESDLRASMAERPGMNLNARIRYFQDCRVRIIEAVGDLEREYDSQKTSENLTREEESFIRRVRSVCNHKLDEHTDRQILDDIQKITRYDDDGEEWPTFTVPRHLRAWQGIISSIRVPEAWVKAWRNDRRPEEDEDAQEG